MRVMLILLCLLPAACTPTGPVPGSPDLASSPYGTCDPATITGGACLPAEAGQTYTCSTWEHDLCCVCVSQGGSFAWTCYGPHVYECHPDLRPSDLADGGPPG